MKIAIDARMIGPENTRGIGRYIEELTKAMAQAEPRNNYLLVTRHPLPRLTEKFSNIQTMIADVSWYGWREQWALPGILKRIKPDVMHIPHWNVPYMYHGPLVITVHDLLLKHQPVSAHSSQRTWPVRWLKKMGYDLVLANAIKKARVICVPTEFTKNDLMSLYPGTEKKIVVTGEGIDHMRDSGSNQLADKLINRASNAVDGPSGYLVYVGSAYPHKRLDLLLEAWKSLSDVYPRLELKIAGEMDQFMTQRRKEASFNEQRINFLGQVTDENLKNLYQGALVTVFPSSFEGFGLPPLESLVLGCPVVSSNATSMPEVLGKKGVVYFKNGSKDDMIKAIKAVVDNHGYYHEQAKQAGIESAVKHSWQKAAKKTLEAYQLVALG